MSSSVSSRLMAARKPARSSRDSKCCRGAGLNTTAATHRGIRSRRSARAQAQADRRRRARPHQCSGQPTSQALAGRAGAARRWRQRVDGAQHPASRESRRRRLSHHRRRRARNRSGPGLAGGADVVLVDHHAGRAHPAPERWQGLCAGDGAAGDPEFLHPGQSDGAARTGAAPHRRPRRRPDGRHICARRRSRVRGRRPSACSLASGRTKCRSGSSGARASSQPASTQPGSP